MEDEREAQEQEQHQQLEAVKDALPTATHSLLEVDAGTPQALAVTVGKVIVVSARIVVEKVIKVTRCKH